MKRIIKHTLILLTAASVVACDDLIYVDLEEKEPLVVIDAFIDNTASKEQRITVAQTQPYFDETRIVGIENATVEVSYGDPATTVTFSHEENGTYTYPSGFGAIGDEFRLSVTVEGETYISTSLLRDTPPVDSVTFRYDYFDTFGEELELYIGAFWARDLEGLGDCYWIKSYKNGAYQNRLDMVNTAFDAGFSDGTQDLDGEPFIPPIRENVNFYGEDEFLSPFEDGDSLSVEIYSINQEVFDFLNLAVSNTNQPGGFGALFASPLSNTPGNIYPENELSDDVVLGCFSVSAVSSGGKRLDVDEVPKE